MALGDFDPIGGGGTKSPRGLGAYGATAAAAPRGLGAYGANNVPMQNSAPVGPSGYALPTLPGDPTRPPDPQYQATGVPDPNYEVRQAAGTYGPGDANLGMQSSDWGAVQKLADQQKQQADQFGNFMSQFAPQFANFDANKAMYENQLGYALANQGYSAGNLNTMHGLQGQMGGLDTRTIQNNMGFMREQLKNAGLNEDLINQMMANYGKMNTNLDSVLGNLGQQNQNLGQIHGMIGQQSTNLNEQLAEKLKEYQENASIKNRDIDSAYTAGGGWFSRFHGEKLTDVDQALKSQTAQANLNNTYQQLGLSQAQIRVLNEQLGNSSSQLQTQNSQLGNTNQQLNLQQELNRNDLSQADITRDLANAGIDLERVGINQQMLDARLGQQLNDLGLSTMYKIDDIYASLRSNDVERVAFAMQLIQQAIAQGLGG